MDSQTQFLVDMFGFGAILAAALGRTFSCVSLFMIMLFIYFVR